MQVDAPIGLLSIAESIQRDREIGGVGYDWRLTVISQYTNSPVLLSVIQQFVEGIDPTQTVEDFFNLIFNIQTARGYGLDVWGRIVGVGRVLQLPIVGAEFLGYEEGDDWKPFGEGVFYTGDTLTNNFALADEPYRRLILAKSLANLSDGSIAAINRILMLLFNEYGNCFVTDGGDMTMTYTFGSQLSVIDFAIISQSGVLPRPVGVTATIVQL